MITKKLLLIFIGLVGICHLADSSVVPNQRLPRQTSDEDENVSTELRFIMVLDAFAEILTSEKEANKLFNYLSEKEEYFFTDDNVTIWILTYLNNFDQLWSEQSDFHNEQFSYRWLMFCAANFLINYAYLHPDDYDYRDPIIEDEFNRLLAEAKWCDNCTRIPLPDTMDRLEISVTAVKAYVEKLQIDECAAPFLKAMWKQVLALPPSGVSEEEWYW